MLSRFLCCEVWACRERGKWKLSNKLAINDTYNQLTEIHSTGILFLLIYYGMNFKNTQQERMYIWKSRKIWRRQNGSDQLSYLSDSNVCTSGSWTEYGVWLQQTPESNQRTVGEDCCIIRRRTGCSRFFFRHGSHYNIDGDFQTGRPYHFGSRSVWRKYPFIWSY